MLLWGLFVHLLQTVADVVRSYRWTLTAFYRAYLATNILIQGYGMGNLWCHLTRGILRCKADSSMGHELILVKADKFFVSAQ